MSSSSLCTYCYCIGGTEKCVKPKCMLPLDGCKPIFVDATCCPVRYDCSQKISGKSSQEVIHTKIKNKHFLRMSQRLQRNRGCTVGKQFYVEGQKMKSDADKPCDICFCIRGNRRCSPKKCAPALKNCLPVVPKGQCCPSSYDCDHQRDYRRADNSRQFNLFNLFFNDEVETPQPNTTIPSEYPHDRNPALAPKEKYNATDHNNDSFFNKIRQGLEFIDTNNEPEKLPLPVDTPVNKEELSLLDLLLEPETDITLDDAMKEDMEEKTTMTSWLDLLLGKDEEENVEALKEMTYTTEYADMSTTTETKELSTMEVESTTELATDATTTMQPTNKYYVENDDRIQLKMEDIFDRNNPPTTTRPITTTSTEKVFVKMELTTKAPVKTTAQTTSTTLPSTTKSTTIKSVTNSTTSTPSTTTTTTEKTDSFLSAIFDGISDILSQNKTANQEHASNKTTATSTTTTTTVRTTIKNITTSTQKTLPMFKPLPTSKPHTNTHTRINSKIANLTLNPNFLLNKSTERNYTQAYKPKSKTTIPPVNKPIATVKPIPIKTILEAEPLEPYIEPTLPPSLPNLKIIPFLPTDAVKADRNKPTSYDNYYNKSPIDKIDYDIYEDPNLYPLLTERFPTYGNANDENKAEYIYKFNVEGPPVSTLTGSAVANVQGFSPPTKTEGGFVPKEPLNNGEDAQNDYQYIIDITTSFPPENTTKPLIESTTINIFKNVMRNDPSPNLGSIMEEQLKTENFNVSSDTNALDAYSYLLQKIISSTTARTTTITAATSTLPAFMSMPTIISTSTLKPMISKQTQTDMTVGTTTATKVLHKTTTPKSNKRKVTKPQTTTAVSTTTAATATVTAAVFQSPFDKLPFMDASFNIKGGNNRKTTGKPSMEKLKTTLKQSTSNITVGPILQTTLPSTTTATSRSDPFGALKLAGCNIYGRMYRVNRVIVELSNNCRECKCTEIGVECKRLDC